MRFCPLCGNAVEPDKNFCTHCGASLKPDLLDTGAKQSGRIQSRFPLSGMKSGKLVLAGVAVFILIVIVIGYPLLMGSSTSPSTTLTGSSGDSPGGSYVIVETEEPTPLPTSELVILATTPLTTTTIMTSIPTTAEIKKPLICATDQRSCNNTCVDVRSDNSNCGECGNTCPTGQSCVNGKCQVPCFTGQTNCPDGCYNLMTDPRHCGSCGNSCPKGLICYMGRCDSPVTPMPVPQ